MRDTSMHHRMTKGVQSGVSEEQDEFARHKTHKLHKELYRTKGHFRDIHHGKLQKLRPHKGVDSGAKRILGISNRQRHCSHRHGRLSMGTLDERFSVSAIVGKTVR